MYEGSIAVAVILFIGFWTVLTIAIGRFGPRRGNWNNPAAVLRPPDNRTRRYLYIGAGIFPLMGLIIIAFVPGGTDSWLALMLISIATAAFCVACAECMRIVGWVARRKDKDGEDASVVATGEELED